MKIPFLLFYALAFSLLFSCGSTKGSSKTSDDTVASNDRKAPDDDYDGVPNDVDQCPYIFGTARTFGCPDADLDGIQDAEDRCPDDKGYANLMGCLDRDYDGVIDPEDECPDAYGERETGCPDIDPSDLDGDGVKNEQDACPELRGLFTANGCPDKDGDSIQDELDACPELFGVAEYDGCPLAIGDMMDLADQYGHPAKVEGIAERGYYKSYDGKLYDKNNLRIDVVAGDIVDANGKFITNTGDYKFDRDGFIRNGDDLLVRLDDEGYIFTSDGLISKTKVNGAGAGGGNIRIDDGSTPSRPGGGGNIRLNNGQISTSGGSNNGGNRPLPDNDNIYDNPINEVPLSPAEAANCNRINLQTLTAAIYFDYDAAKADQSSLRQLNRVVDAMQKCASLELQVGGHTDSDGSNAYNLKLSERRAKAVLKYLTGKGISDRRLKYNAYGEKYPMGDNDTETGKQRNRRTEIKAIRG
jgi:outer membrane protein OmpA-like peptidoglycan-associated protein